MRASFSLLKDSKAFGGSGPWVYPEFFRISLLRSAEIKSLIALRKNEVSLIKPLIPFMEFGAGQFRMTSVLASPGEMPLFVHIS